MTVVPVVTGALGAVSDMFDKHMKKFGITIRLEVIQERTPLGNSCFSFSRVVIDQARSTFEACDTVQY